MLSLLLLLPLAAAGDPAADLRLRLEPVGEVPAHPWWGIEIRLLCRNVSEEAAHPVVRPSTASFDGRREPRAAWRIAEGREDGTWVDVPHLHDGICAQFDADWRDDVVIVQPGEEAEILRWSLTRNLAELDTTEVRLGFHYEYTARPARASWMAEEPLPEAEAFGAMRGVRPFSLEAGPLELSFAPPHRKRWKIERDLELVAERLDEGAVASWGPMPLRVSVRNRSSTETHLFVPSRPRRNSGGVHLDVRVDRGDGRWTTGRSRTWSHHYPSRDEDWRDEVVELGPGESLELFALDPSLAYTLDGLRRVRVGMSYLWGAVPARPRNRPVPPIPEAFGRMAAVPPFRLTAEPLVVPIESPLAVELRPRASSAAKAESLSDLLEVALVNRADRALELASEAAPAIFEIALPGGHRRFELTGPIVLAPKGEARVFGGLLPATDPAFEWPPPTYGRAVHRFSASFQREGWLVPVVAEHVDFGFGDRGR